VQVCPFFHLVFLLGEAEAFGLPWVEVRQILDSWVGARSVLVRLAYAVVEEVEVASLVLTDCSLIGYRCRLSTLKKVIYLNSFCVGAKLIFFYFDVSFVKKKEREKRNGKREKSIKK
jgi:hypothetical protein